MVNLYSYRMGQQASGGYLQNRMTSLTNPGQLDETSATAQQNYNASQALNTSDAQQPWWQQAGEYAAAAPADVVDTVGSLFPGVQRGQIDDGFWNSIGMPGMADWTRRNKGGVEIGSALLGGALIGGASDLALGGVLGSSWFAATGLGRATEGAIQLVARAKQAAAASALDSAAAGLTPSFWATTGRVAAAAALRGAAKASVSEAAVMAAMHNNSAVWSDDMTQNLLMAGLGVGLGGTLGAIQGRSFVRKWMNSPEVQMAAANYADPGRFERIATEAGVAKHAPIKPTALTEVQKPSSEFTRIMLNAENNDSEVVAANGTKTAPAANINTNVRNTIRTANRAQAEDALFRTTRQGVNDDPTTAISRRAPAAMHILQAAHEDPTILLGAASVGQLPEDGFAGIKASRIKYIQALDASTDAADRQLAGKLTLQQPLAIVNKSLMPIADAEALTTYRPEMLDMTQVPGTNSVRGSYGGHNILVEENGRVNIPWQSMTPDVQNATVDVMNNVMKKMLAAREPMVLPVKPEYHQIDMALQYESLGGKVNYLKSGLGNTEAAQLESLRQKSVLAAAVPQLDAQTRFKLNLPQATSAERVIDPAGTALKATIAQAGKPGVTMTQLQQLRGDIGKTLELTSGIDGPQELSGNMFTFNRSVQSADGVKVGDWLKPSVAYYDDVPATKWTRFDLGADIAERASVQAAVLRGNLKAPTTSAITDAVLSQPDFMTAKTGISGAMDSQVGGTKNAIDATMAQFLTKGQLFRDSPLLTATQRVRRIVNVRTEKAVNDALFRLKPHIDYLSSAAGQHSKVLMDQYFSHMSGWDVLKTVQTPDGMTAFVLDHTSNNNALQLGRAVKQGDLAINTFTGKPIVLDDAANEARLAFDIEFESLRQERNTVRQALGYVPVGKRMAFVPAPSTSGMKVGFTIGPDNKVVPRKAVVAPDQGEFNKARDALKLLPGERFYSIEQLRMHDDIWHTAGIDFLDPTQMAAPSGTAKGRLVQQRISNTATEDALLYLKRGYESNSNGIVRTLFAPQLQTAAIREEAAQASGQGSQEAKSIWRQYTETLMGVHNIAAPVGLNAVMLKADDWANQIIASHWKDARNTSTVTANYMRDVADRFLPQGMKRANTYDALAQQLGPYLPFADAMQHAEYTYGVTPPPEVKQIAAKLNRLSASLVLRYFEVPNAAMNMAGIITNTPGLLTSKSVPLLGHTPNGIGIVDSAKIMARGFKRMLSEHSGADWDRMVLDGNASQDFIEANKQLAGIKSQSTFKRAFFGDPSTPALPPNATLKQKAVYFAHTKGIDGIISAIQDTSEQASRQWAHFTGLEMADHLGITGMDARHAFAQSIANDAIANYDPMNRPEIFNSAFGSLYGLFTSYVQNYYQRMFRWMEEGDYKALGVALGAQASMFGFASVPGYQQLSDYFGGADTDGTIMDGVYKRFGPKVGSVVMHGGLAQLTTLFNAPAIALYTRGDMQYRIPAVQLQAPVGLQVLANVVDAGYKLLIDGAIAHRDTMSEQYVAETLARDMPNRFLHGALTVLAGNGIDADANSNVLSTTQGAGEAVYRLLGVRSSRQQAEIEAFYLNKQKLAIDSQRRSMLDLRTRSLIRAGKFDQLPAVFDEYLKTGGQPTNYPTWLKGIIQGAKSSRTQNQLLKALRNPAQQDLAKRIQLFTAPY